MPFLPERIPRMISMVSIDFLFTIQFSRQNKNFHHIRNRSGHIRGKSWALVAFLIERTFLFDYFFVHDDFTRFFFNSFESCFEFLTQNPQRIVAESRIGKPKENSLSKCLFFVLPLLLFRLFQLSLNLFWFRVTETEKLSVNK